MSYNLGQIDPEERTGLYADPRDEETDRSPRRVLRIVGALLVMALFAGGLWFAYIEGLRHAGGTGVSGGGDIPLIRADTRPMKVKPAEPGGMPIPGRDMLIYGQSRPVVEHLLPPPEQPMALPAPPPPAPKPAVSASAGAPPMAVPSTVVTAPGTASAVAAARPEQLAGGPPGNPNATPSKSVVAMSQPGKAAGVRLQLGSVRSEGNAREEWARVKRGNPDLLGHLTAVAVRADLGDKGIYYRILAGPVGDPATAAQLCGELRERHLACIIVR